MDPKMKLEPTVAYRGRNDVVFVPHYNMRDVYVSPGGRYYSREHLAARGAQPFSMNLWPRPKA